MPNTHDMYPLTVAEVASLYHEHRGANPSFFDAVAALRDNRVNGSGYALALFLDSQGLGVRRNLPYGHMTQRVRLSDADHLKITTEITRRQTNLNTRSRELTRQFRLNLALENARSALACKDPSAQHVR